MKLTFLGSSHGVPAADRHCQCMMLEVENNVYIFDAGAPVVEGILAAGHSMDDLKTVFITHVHSDHTNNLFALANLCNWYFRTTNVNFYVPEARLWDGVVAYNTATSLLDFDADRLHPVVFDESTVYDDGTIRVTPIATQHMAANGYPAYAFAIEAEGKRILITGDMSQGLKANDFPKIAFEKHFDLLISELAHFDVEQMEENHKKVLCSKFVYTHVNAIEKKFPKIRALNGTLPYPVLIAEDGDIFEI